MTYLTSDRSAFEFVILAALRTKQLMAGCLPRVSPCPKLTSTAALEVLTGKVARLVDLTGAIDQPVRYR